MADLHRARRRADEFARLVDGGAEQPPAHSTVPDDDPELSQSLVIVERLRSAGAVTPDAAFNRALRDQLVEAAGAAASAAAIAGPDDPQGKPDTQGDDAPDPKDTRRAVRRRRGRVVAGASVLAVLAGGIGTAAAAQTAMPGDSLYGMKRGIERVSNRVSVSDDSRGRRELAHALTRLREVETLVGGGPASSRISSTLADFSHQARNGSAHLLTAYARGFDAADVDTVHVFAEEARGTLTILARRVPAGSRQSVAVALSTLSEISAQAARLCPVCLAPSSKQSLRPTPTGTIPTPSTPASTITSVPDPSLGTAHPTAPPGSGEQTERVPRHSSALPKPSDPATPTAPPSKPSLPGLTPLPTPPRLPLPTLPLPRITLPGVTLPGLPPLLPPVSLGGAAPGGG